MRRGFALHLVISLIAIISLIVSGLVYHSLNKNKPVKTQNNISASSPSTNSGIPLTSISQTPTPSSAANSQQSIDTSSWKTYVSPTSDWQIKYPSDWEVIPTGACDVAPPNPCGNIIFQGTDVSNGKCLDPNVRCGQFQVIPLDVRATTFQQKVDEIKNPIIQEHFLVDPLHEVDIAGTKGFQIIYHDNSGGSDIIRVTGVVNNPKQKVYKVINREGYYGDKYQIKSINDWKLLHIFNAMQSTFKFTN